jgi:hypothetical protein
MNGVKVNDVTRRATMRAAYVERLGAVEEIRIGELPAPTVRANEVLLQVDAAAVDPVDALTPLWALRHAAPCVPVRHWSRRRGRSRGRGSGGCRPIREGRAGVEQSSRL